jgi:hypothetical protein
MQYMSLWYNGSSPADISLAFDDGADSGSAAIDRCTTRSDITICQYVPGQEFVPWQSSSGDRGVWIGFQGHVGGGVLRIRGRQAGGSFDVYGSIDGNLQSAVSFSDHLKEGRLTDYSTTRSAIVVGDYSAQSGAIWPGSSGGPTRDGRLGVDLVAPGEDDIVPLAAGSFWSIGFPAGTMYRNFGATSGSAPIVVGAVAMMLQLRPQLTASQIRDILRRTTSTDRFTGPTPNPIWGHGKLDVLKALNDVSVTFPQASRTP